MESRLFIIVERVSMVCGAGRHVHSGGCANLYQNGRCAPRLPYLSFSNVPLFKVELPRQELGGLGVQGELPGGEH